MYSIRNKYSETRLIRHGEEPAKKCRIIRGKYNK